MLNELKQRELDKRPIRVGLIGAGAMGIGIAWQVNRTPGMQLVFVADIDVSAARQAALSTGLRAQENIEGLDLSVLHENGEVIITGDPLGFIRDAGEEHLDVIVEASNTVGPAARYCLQAIDCGLDVVLMNAEVDLALGFLLHHYAEKRGVVVTSDAGDQHGVLRRMIDEIQLWGFELVQAGNIKGYLDRYATAQSLMGEASKRNLSPIQCCAYTDGSKLSIEMACLANSVGLIPQVPGMVGPRATHVDEALDLFDFESYGQEGRIDYLLGAEPGGGVYVVGRCDDPLQAGYMEYYKQGKGPHYLFYRPYHLCHIETPTAIAEAVISRRAVMRPGASRLTDVYAYAKRDLVAGELIPHSIGGNEFYGLVERCSDADAAGKVPLALLEAEGEALPAVKVAISKDDELKFNMVEIPDSFLTRKFDEQRSLELKGG
ncbi:MAG: homoserine dehydrogenase [Verrucomicrobiaceae bacterium]|nr:homoserine dehydrogenase [Verrucomicrobiaceae bacterium]